MNEKIVVPALGESVTEATIAKWLKSVGDTVEVEDPIVELERVLLQSSTSVLSLYVNKL